MISDNYPATMDIETAKEIEDLQNNLKALVSRKRKREDAALEDENTHLQKENARLKRDKMYYANNAFGRIPELATMKQSNDELEKDIKRLKNEMKQQVMSKTFLQQSHDKEVAKQAKTIKTHVSETRQLKLKIINLQVEINDLQKHKVASNKAVSDLKTKRRLEMEAEFKLLVSDYIMCLEVVSGVGPSNNATGRNLTNHFLKPEHRGSIQALGG
jgi:DNA repair exonuclease SbcCD ATPase subunit